ncbi:hypothetical protein CRENBAI_013647, partial [Crenichthys baileyi]
IKWFPVLVLVVFRLSGKPGRGAADSAETPRRPLPSPGGAQGIPRPPKNIVPPACAGPVPWASSPPWGGLEHLPRKGSRRHPGYRCPGPLNGSSRCGGAAALLRALPQWLSSSPYISRECPATPRRKLISPLCIRDLVLRSCPKFMAIGEGRNVDRP